MNGTAAVETGRAPVLAVKDMRKHFSLRSGLFGREKGKVYAVDGVSFTVAPGETLAVVGESGCGKSTLGKVVLKLEEPTSGSIRLNDVDITHLSRRRMHPLRTQIQTIFQDPYASLNQRMRALEIVAEPLQNYLDIDAASRRRKVLELFERVGLRSAHLYRYPHEFSGGQRQRLGIARALALNPDIIIADEPVSALDVSVQAQVLNLLVELQRSLGISYLFIAHDLAVVQHISHRIAVMYLGKIVELTTSARIVADPQHPYTEALLSAVPEPRPGRRKNRIVLKGDVPSPVNPPKGCNFNTRCPYAIDRCFVEEPQLKRLPRGADVACHLR